MSTNIIEFGLDDKKKIKRFVKFPYGLYRGEKYWVPKLNVEYLGSRLLGAVGMFEKRFPFHATANVRFFLAIKNGKEVGRICGIVDQGFENYYGWRQGSFGFFESVNDYEVSDSLLAAAETWCQQQGAKNFVGPYSFSINHVCGILIKGFDDYPSIEMPYNHAYYGNLLSHFGLKKAIDLHSFSVTVDQTDFKERMSRIKKIGDRALKRCNAKLRTADPKHLGKEVKTFISLYNHAWKGTWGFLPISEAEGEILAEGLKMILDPRIFLFATVDDREVAVCGNVPDINSLIRIKPDGRYKRDLLRLVNLLLKKTSISHGRCMLLGIHKDYTQKGIEAALFHQAFSTGFEIGYQSAEYGWVREDHKSLLKLCESMGGKLTKTQRIYCRQPFDATR